MPTAPGEPQEGSRRGFLWWATVGLVGAAVTEVAWIVSSFARPRPSVDASRGATAIVAGRAEDFAPGSVTAFPAGRFYLARLPDGGFMALDRKCPHLGCTVPWDESRKRFVCPCHGSTFDMRGEVESPPAPRPLDLLPVRIENGLVKVDTGRSVARERFEPSQVTFR